MPTTYADIIVSGPPDHAWFSVPSDGSQCSYSVVDVLSIIVA
jgi:hypothetical protein